MADIGNPHGNFFLEFTEDGETGFLSINPEMKSYSNVITPTGRYCIYCMHPKHGSCTFVIGLSHESTWICDFSQPFITNQFVEWIGETIEHNNK